ncbi:hypothetical protein Despr_1873 [Desulfobulbus propionicus DSM 2032]|jgi:hypothetical protein|uniref:FlgO domain-containing protein n=1 Tax=Desulfobulbus propionicus (strain ATCC 33891 / DSM 2032 / VKM B-1956 / 1pr3) TaxID=577650 RepID=A0A7U3YMC3_DESPD|nr:FlgO family outer membrane protein [Desulfobulbus propionicus]ADW18021.1 hypothetical protein Despr_1873 [Desulfobulbus propionicus DSM 2032]
MKSFFRSCCVFVVCLLLCLSLSACSDFNGTRLEPFLGGDVNLVELGDKVAETLIMQTLPPLIPHQGDQPILITTLVNNDNLSDTSSFGRSFQNNIAAGFVARGYTVKELKLRRDLLVELHKGEFMLTRNLAEMAGIQRAQAVVVGTYALANRVMYLSVRLVSPKDQTIKATYEDKLTLDANSLRMLGLRIKNGADRDPIEPALPPSPSVLDDLLY